MKTHIQLLIIALCLISAGAWSQNIILTTAVNEQDIALGDTVRLTVVLETDSINNAQTLFPQVGPISDCVISGPFGSSWSTRFSSGSGGTFAITRMQQTYLLQPGKVGVLTIPALKVEYQGETYSSQPITVNVLGDEAARKAAALQTVNPTAGQLDNQLAKNIAAAQPGSGVVYPTSRSRELNDYLRQGVLYLQAEVVQDKIYAGDVFQVRYHLHFQNIVRQWLSTRRLSLSFTDQELAGFQIVNQRQVSTIDAQPVMVDGQQYFTALVCELLLQPQQAGKQTIPAWGMIGRYRSPDDRLGFGGFRGFSRFSVFDDGTSFEVPSDITSVEVLPLPLKGRSASFSGAVGDFNITAELDNREIAQWDVVTLKIRIFGRGSVYTIGAPQLPPLARFEQFGELKSTVEPTTRGRRELWGAKTFELVLRPKEAGELEIPPITYAFFDPKTEEYVERSSKRLMLKVNPGAGEELPVIVAPLSVSTNGTGGGAPLTIELNKDIMFIPDEGFRGLRERRPLVLTAGYWGFQVGPLALILFAAFTHRRRERLAGDVQLARRRGARGAAAKRLRAARRFLKKGLPDEFHAELSRGIRGFLSAHLSAGAHLSADAHLRARAHITAGDHGLTVDDIAAELSERDLDAKLIEQTRQLLDDCDNARYAPGCGEVALRRTYQRGEKLLDQLMRVLK